MILALASLLAVLAVTSTPALAAEETPQWRVTSTFVPTNLAPNSPVSETADVTIDATGGTFTLGFGSEPQTTAIPYNASPEAVQAAFLNIKNGGVVEKEVTVTGTPGAYVLTYPPYINYGIGREEHVIANGSNLTGGEHAATVRIVTVGRTAPTLVVTAINVGGGSTDGGRITLSDSLPAGFTATSVKGADAYKQTELACTVSPLQCTSTGVPVDPGDNLIVEITLSVAGPPTITEGMSISNHASVSGGAAVPVAADVPLTISSTPAGFGIVPDSLVSALSSTRAGAHANLTTAFTLNTGPDLDERPVVDPKDVEADIPRGLIGNVVGMPWCTQRGVQELVSTNGKSCPADSMVGTATLGLTTYLFGPALAQGYVFPVYNIAPSPGEPAAFSFLAIGFPVRLDISVLSNGDYGVRATAGDISEAGGDVSSVVTIWGVPADHNGPGPDQLKPYGGSAVHFGGPGTGEHVALLSNPTQCSEQLSGTISTDSWTEPGVFHSASVSSGTLTGCDALPFFSSASMLPDTLQAGAPAGYHFDLKVDRSQDTAPEGVSAPDVKNVVTTLPIGTVISPSAANGLAACRNDPGVDPAFAPNEFGLHSLNLASCDQASRVGTVQITSPDIAEPFGGAVYLAKPECEPCTPQDAEDGKMVKLLLQAKGEGEGGVLVKVVGSLSVNQQTGQLTATFANNPQLPFNDLKLTLGGGPRATLSNPRVCGPASTNVDLTPWSSPFSPDSIDTSTFEVSGCQAPRFAPSFTAGTTSNQAGGFSPFTLSFGRGDADQYLAGVQLRTPPGLLGSLANVPLCPEPQASQGTCGAGSLIGHTQVLTGPGAEPFLVTGGQVFLTGPYRGAPFGLSIVVPAAAGPFNLGNVVTRGTLKVDPYTARVTATSTLPTIVKGIPLRLKRVSVNINKQGFLTNPTNCGALQTESLISGFTPGTSTTASVELKTQFQVSNCSALAFKPSFKSKTSAKTSRANGASLETTLNIGTGQTNVKSVMVQLPKQLPSRLTTLQKACSETVFATNPYNCPSGSFVGGARANTPTLPGKLTGPAILVSHGGQAFPDLDLVMEANGVRVILVGNTKITKGITTTTFATLPDVPVSSVTVNLPIGGHSAVTANGSLCINPLTMPTTLIGQNGFKVTQKTKIAVVGCPVRIAGQKTIGNTAYITVQTYSAGRISGSGSNLATTYRHLNSAQKTATLKVPLSRGGQSKGRPLKVRLRVGFVPKKKSSSNSNSASTTTVVFR